MPYRWPHAKVETLLLISQQGFLVARLRGLDLQVVETSLLVPGKSLLMKHRLGYQRAYTQMRDLVGVARPSLPPFQATSFICKDLELQRNRLRKKDGGLEGIEPSKTRIQSCCLSHADIRAPPQLLFPRSAYTGAYMENWRCSTTQEIVESGN